MIHRALYRLTVLVSLIILSTVVVSAATVLDSFDFGEQTICEGGASSICKSFSLPSSNALDVTGIPGGERDVRLYNYTGGAAEQVFLRVNAGGSGLLSLSQDSGAGAKAEVTWDGNDDDATTLSFGLNLDLTSGGTDDAFEFVTTFNDLPVNVQIVVHCSNTSSSSATLSLPGGITNSTNYVIPFSSFSGTCDPSTTNVQAVQLLIDGTVTLGADLNIDWFGTTATQRDYGDLPDAYGTTQASNGARHVVDSLKLGATVDTESDGTPSANADGDGTDEDGVVRTPGINWNSSGGGSVDVTVNGCGSECYVNGWIDWNNDGDFNDTGEHIIQDKKLSGDGTTSVPFSIPSTTDPHNNTYYARFRLCHNSGECNTPTGEVVGGEVEDYKWSFGPTAVTLETFSGTGMAASTTQMAILIAALFLAFVGLVSVFAFRR